MKSISSSECPGCLRSILEQSLYCGYCGISIEHSSRQNPTHVSPKIRNAPPQSVRFLNNPMTGAFGSTSVGFSWLNVGTFSKQQDGRDIDPDIHCRQCHGNDSSQTYHCVNFCGRCGVGLTAKTSTEIACAACGERTLEGSVYCGHCGLGLHTTKARTDHDNEESRRSINPIPIAEIPLPSFAIAGHTESGAPWLIAIVGAAVVGTVMLFWHFAAAKQELASVPAPTDPRSDSPVTPAASAPESASVTRPMRILTKDPQYAAILEALPSASEEIQSYFERHRTDWFEIGHIEPADQDRVSVNAINASLVRVDSGQDIPVSSVMLESAYTKFRSIAENQIDAAANSWVDGRRCSNQLRNVCENLGGSDCSSPSVQSEIWERLGTGLSLDCEANPSFQAGRDVAFKQMRQTRVVLVGQGDPLNRRIDQLFLVDYDSETILLNIDPGILAGKRLHWRFDPEVDPSPEDSSSANSVQESGNTNPVWPLTQGAYIAGASDSIPPFPEAVSGYESEEGRDYWGKNFPSRGTVYAFDDSTWVAVSPRLPATMNGCSEGIFMIRWRTLSPDIAVESSLGPYTTENIPRLEQLIAGRAAPSPSTSGYMVGTNCDEPMFKFSRSGAKSDSTRVQISYELKFWHIGR